jgi:hypothetical protein
MSRPPDTSADPAAPRRRRFPSTTAGRILARVAFYGAFLFLALPMTFCHVMTSVPRQEISAPPPGYERIEIESEGL